MQQVNLGMLLGILYNRIGHDPAHRRVGIAQAGVERDTSPQLTLALDKCKVLHSLGWHALGRVFPTQAGDAKWLACPAVADRVIDKVALFGFSRDLTDKRTRLLDAEPTFLIGGMPHVRVPPIEEREALAELDKVGVEADLWHPVDQVAHVLVAYRAFDADAAMPIRWRLDHLHGSLGKIDGWNVFAIRARPHPATAEHMQVAIHREQDTARVVAADEPVCSFSRNADGVIKTRIGVSCCGWKCEAGNVLR